MENIVVEKEEVQLTKEEKLANALNFVNDEKLAHKAKILFQKGIYSKEKVENFTEEDYEDITIKPYKGYSLLTNEAGELFYVKELNTEAESETYAYEVISFPTVTEEQMHQLMHYKRPVNGLKVATLSVFLVFTVFTLFTFFYTFFEQLASSFIGALAYSFLSVGSSLAVCLGVLCLLFNKPHHKGCKCKK